MRPIFPVLPAGARWPLALLLLGVAAPAGAAPPAGACALPEGWAPVPVDDDRKSCACVGLGRVDGQLHALVGGACAVELTITVEACGGPVRALLRPPAAGQAPLRYPLSCASGAPMTTAPSALSARRVKDGEAG